MKALHPAQSPTLYGMSLVLVLVLVLPMIALITQGLGGTARGGRLRNATFLFAVTLQGTLG
jgi:hypothetical protein